jgi:hypothetical protein
VNGLVGVVAHGNVTPGSPDISGRGSARLAARSCKLDEHELR